MRKGRISLIKFNHYLIRYEVSFDLRLGVIEWQWPSIAKTVLESMVNKLN